LTKQYYGTSGQKSIDPVVFFKLCLVGYLENLISDRQLIQHSGMRLDILYFLGYDIDEVIITLQNNLLQGDLTLPEGLKKESFVDD